MMWNLEIFGKVVEADNMSFRWRAKERVMGSWSLKLDICVVKERRSVGVQAL